MKSSITGRYRRIIGAAGDTGEGGAGINWRVKLMNIKIVGNSGSGELTRLPEAIRYAVDNGAHVINMSFVGSVDGDVKSAVKYAYDKGVAVIAAAGNDLVSLNSLKRYPVCADAGEAEDWVLGVTAISQAHRIAPFSNTGSDCIDITAPGVQVSSTLRYAPSHGLRDIYGGPWSGTSFAAPFVSGAAALLKSMHPEWRAPEIYEALLKTVHKTPPKDEEEYANLFGAGLIQIHKAVAYAAAQPSVSRQVFSRLLFLDTKNARMSEFYPESQASQVVNQPTVKGADDVVSYSDGADYRLATVKPIAKKTSEVTWYSSAWVKLGSIRVSSGGALRVTVADVLGDEEKEIIVAPAYASQELFRIFSTDGKLLREVRAPASHTGVTLGLWQAGKNAKSEIVAVYQDEQGMGLHQFDSEIKDVKRMTLPFRRPVGNVSVGDVTGDSTLEYVVGSGTGDEPGVAFFAADGTRLRLFSGYNTSYRGGIRTALGDYDGDGKNDVLLAAQGGGQPVSVWSSQVRSIVDLTPFGAESPGVIVIPFYR